MPTAVKARSRDARSGSRIGRRAGGTRDAISTVMSASRAALSQWNNVVSSGTVSMSSIPMPPAASRSGKPRKSDPAHTDAPVRRAQMCIRWVLPQLGSPQIAKRRSGHSAGRASQARTAALDSAWMKSDSA